MKILSVTFQNLNSLSGRWSVDFTDDAFADAGIFAITGPTGSGKSTILDAICLALYGRTPRIEKISQRENEVMSRQTGECDAEVTFSCASGKFICKWHQHRSRKSPTGALQLATHEISDDGGNILSGKLSRVAEIVEEKTGLSFERFTRSVMLAQGRFGAFLESGADARAPILEQITGTEIYSEISIAVHERKRLEEDTLKGLLGQKDLVQPLSDEALAEKKATQQEATAQLKVAEKKQADVLAAIGWRQTIASMESELENLKQQAATLRAEKQAFEPQRVRLKQAQIAASLAPSYRELMLKRERVLGLEKETASLAKQLPEIMAREKNAADAVAEGEKRLVALRDEFRKERVVQQEVRKLDVEIRGLDKRIAEVKGEAGHHRQLLGDREKELAGTKQALEALDRATKKSRDYLAAHAMDEEIEQKLPAIDAALQQMAALHDRETALERDLRNEVDDLSKLETALRASQTAEEKAAASHRAQTADIRERQHRIEVRLDNVPVHAHQEQLKSLREQHRLADLVRKLEDERQRLKDGDECPLCGSKHHPFAEGQHPVPDDLETRIGALERLIDDVQREEAALGRQKDALAKSDRALQAHAFETKSLQQKIDESKARIKRIDDDHQKSTLQCDTVFQTLQGYLKPFHGSDFRPDAAEEIRESVARRASLWEKARAAVVEAEPRKQALILEQKALETALSEMEMILQRIDANVVALESERDPLADTRQKLYGERNPDEEAVLWEKRILDAEANFEAAEQRHESEKVELTKLKAHLERRRSDLELCRNEQAAFEPVFAESRSRLGFGDETDFLSAGMSDVDIARLEATFEKLNDNEKRADALKRDLTARIDVERRRALTERSNANLQTDLKSVQVEVKTLGERLGAIGLQLKEDALRRKDAAAIRERIETQQAECLKWQRLHELIGSSDGKKYRNFAQGLTFRRLITYANVQLARMTDRYLLHPSSENPIEFTVMDNHQGGEFRSTRNLSGGEGFIVSLALALGLSQMSSHRVQIDSLFLDEGFGTLDDEALETALDTLSSLHQEGKLIGIISHVPALKDRISCQIQVIRQSGGKSRLQGPGCAREQ